MVDLAMHMMDIVQNAIRANATRIDIGFLEESRKGTLTFTVSDNGSGMVPETVERGGGSLLHNKDNPEDRTGNPATEDDKRAEWRIIEGGFTPGRNRGRGGLQDRQPRLSAVG